jgi:hypothetical protein
LSAPTPAFGSSNSIQAPIGVAQPPESPAYFGAPTPGYIGMGLMNRVAEEESAPGDDWITAPALSRFAYGFIVRIQGTLDSDEAGWNGGKYENSHGFVTGVNVASADKNVASYVSIRFKGEFEGTIMDVPHKFVKPFAPREVGQRVVVIAGRRIGTRGTVREIDHDSNSCTAETTGPDSVIDSFDCNSLTVYEEES